MEPLEPPAVQESQGDQLTLDLSDCDAAWRWAKANVDISEDFEDTARERTEIYCCQSWQVQRAGAVDIFRLVVLTDIQDLDPTQIGSHWSFEREGVGDYGLNRGRLPGEKDWLLAGRVNLADIDWEYDLASFLYYGEAQWECALRVGARVPILAINGNPLPQPMDCLAFNVNKI